MGSRVIDISRSIAPGVAVYPGDDPLGETQICAVGEDAPCSITGLSGWTTHFLTHVDPPKHFVAGGAGLDDIPLSRFIVSAVVVEVEGNEVKAEDVPSQVEGMGVLFKTRNSSLDPAQFHEDHVYIGGDASRALIDRHTSLVGIDYLSVDRFGDENYPAHRELLQARILILEGLDLSGVSAGAYELIALPLKIGAGDGSPVRAVLRKD